MEFSWQESGNVQQDLSKIHLWIECFLSMWHEGLGDIKGDCMLLLEYGFFS
jgi:hypothetical protein